MTLRLLPLAGLGVLAVLVVISAMLRTARERIATVGLARLIVRWFLGHPWHGGHITDSGWNREGRKALTAVGHARRFWHRPGKHRAAIRTAETLGPVAVAYGLVFYTRATIWLLAAVVAVGLCYYSWRAWKAWQRRTWRRSWLYPLHKTIAPMLSLPLAVSPESYLRLALDRSRVTLELPPGFRSTRDMERLEQAVSATLAIEAPDVEWDRSGAKPNVTFTSSRTPARVTLADVRGAVAAAGRREDGRQLAGQRAAAAGRCPRGHGEAVTAPPGETSAMTPVSQGPGSPPAIDGSASPTSPRCRSCR